MKKAIDPLFIPNPLLGDLDKLTTVLMYMVVFAHGVVQKSILMGDDHVTDVQVLEEVHQAVLGLRIQPGGGFVQQEQPGLHGQDRGQGDQLLFAPGEIIGHPVLEAFKSQPLHGLPGNLQCRGRRLPLIKGTEGDVLQDGGTEELIVGILEEQAHLLPDRHEILLFADCLSEDDDFARLGAEQAHDQVQQGGLAAAVGTDEAEVFARQELKIKVLENRTGSSGVGKGDVLQFDQRFTHQILTRSPGVSHSR